MSGTFRPIGNNTIPNRESTVVTNIGRCLFLDQNPRATACVFIPYSYPQGQARMSVRVVARIRPLLKSELDKDVIVEVCPSSTTADATCVRIPNPRNEAENFSFDFGNVYSDQATQQQIFDDEGAFETLNGIENVDMMLTCIDVLQLRQRSSTSSKASMSRSSLTESLERARHTRCAGARAWLSAA